MSTPRTSSDTRTDGLPSDSDGPIPDSQAPTPRPSRPASIAPSISTVLSDASTITGPNHVQRGFKTREGYLAALQEFADSKSYMEPGDYTLQGWYGTRTMDDYKQRMSWREERRARKAKEKQARELQRRTTVASTSEQRAGREEVSNTSESSQTGEGQVEQPEGSNAKDGHLRRLSRVFTGGRRATVT